MPREADPPSVERNFILDALHENIRIDGRALDQFRPLSLTFGSTYGTATVQLGKTRSVEEQELTGTRLIPD